AALTARTAVQWQYLLPQIEASADAGDDWLMRLMLARGHHELGQPQQALGALRRALEQGGPEPVRAWLKSFAGDAAARSQSETARWYLAACAELGLADAEAQLMLAELHAGQERVAEAAAALQQAISLAPDSHHVRRHAAGLYCRLAQWDAASAELTRALELAGGNSDLWRARARCFAEMSRWEQAADDLSQAVQREPNNADLREWLAIALVSANDLPAYRALCADTLRRFNRTDYARRPWIAPKLLALAPEGLSDYEPILGPALDFEARYPRNCVTYHVLGPYQYRAGQWADAARQTPADDSNQAVMVDELLFVAMAHLRLGRTRDARRILEQVEKSRWQDFDVWSRQRVQLLLDETRGLLSE
ncbi:MAG: tetratricopeptide repeat protein, partial [Pirellulaceae bacterium]|nr:tetratricopeptide repeat protein [Pirellulaceae bacterium]